MRKSVVIRVRKETRDRLHFMKNLGQTLDGLQTINSVEELEEACKTGIRDGRL